DIGRDRHRFGDLIAHGFFPFVLLPPLPLPPLPLGGEPPRSSGAMRDRTLAVTANRTARRSGDGPNGGRTGRATHHGVGMRMYSRLRVIRVCPSSLLMWPGSQPGEKKTCTAAVMTRPWTTWMERAAVSARHHQRAAQAVCGNAWRASRTGAEAASSTTAI